MKDEGFLKIVSDGTTKGTILTGPDGKQIGFVKQLIWVADADKQDVELTLHKLRVPIEAVVKGRNVRMYAHDTERMQKNFTIEEKCQLGKKAAKQLGEGTIFSNGKVCITWYNGETQFNNDDKYLKTLRDKYNIRSR